MSDDLIRRSDAIEALGEEPYVWTDDDEFTQGERSQWIADVSALKAVPSADGPVNGVLFKGRLEEGDYNLIKTTDGWVLKGETSYVGFNICG